VADVAVLGTGRMGSAMVRRLAEAGHRVTIWNRTRAAADTLAASIADPDVVVAESPAHAVATADFVLVMLASGVISEAVLLADDVVAAIRPNAIVCDLGTSGVSAAHNVSAALAAAGKRFVDAPVSGSVPTVAAGQLLIMASGDPDDIAQLTPILEAFAKLVVRVGAAGSGQAMKLAVNLVVHQLNAAVSEALVLATRAGIHANAAYDVFQASVIGAPFLQYKRAAFLSEGTPVAMSLDLTAKDLGLIAGFADSLSLPAVATRAVRSEVEAACNAGFGSRDMADLFRFLAAETAEPA
jgi:3-hydroxyisobutyrate dehydrogenase